MRRFLLLLLIPLTLSFSGCTGMASTSGTSSAVVQAQDAASRTLYAFGAGLEAIPAVVDALYQAGKITKDQRNSVVPIYNRALASFNLAVSALSQAVTAGVDPSTSSGYSTAFATFMLDKNNIENLILALGGQPIGQGVK